MQLFLLNFLVAQFLFLFHLYDCMILQLSPLYILRFLLCQLQFIHPQLIISTLFPYILIWNHRGYLQSLYTLAHPRTSHFLPVVFLYHSTLFLHIPLFLILSYDLTSFFLLPCHFLFLGTGLLLFQHRCCLICTDVPRL